MNISLETIPDMTPAQRAAALATIQRSRYLSKSEDGQTMIKLIEFFDAGATQSATIGNADVTVDPGVDGVAGTADDKVTVKRRK